MGSQSVLLSAWVSYFASWGLILIALAFVAFTGAWFVVADVGSLSPLPIWVNRGWFIVDALLMAVPLIALPLGTVFLLYEAVCALGQNLKNRPCFLLARVN